MLFIVYMVLKYLFMMIMLETVKMNDREFPSKSLMILEKKVALIKIYLKKNYFPNIRINNIIRLWKCGLSTPTHINGIFSLQESLEVNRINMFF